MEAKGMRYAEFCGKKASVIALGTANFGETVEKSRAWELLDAYVEAGGNFIDTARVYGHFSDAVEDDSEGIIGDWLDYRNNREKLILSTKGGHPDISTGASRLDRASVLNDLETSLDALYTDYVDIFWLHRDDPERPLEEIMETLTEITERGWAKYVGVSNWSAMRIMEAQACARECGLTRIYADQPQFSLARQINVEDPTLVQMDAALYNYHAITQTPCVCFTSMAKGFLTKLAAGGEASLSDKARRRYLCKENLDVLERTKAIAEKEGISVHSTALAYLTSQPFPCFPIAGVSKIEQVQALREAGDVLLTPEQVDFLRKF